LSHRRLWIIDPLDGTSNFLAKGDEYCVSIGLSVEGRAVLGVVYNPAHDQLFAGYARNGVMHNGLRVRMSEASKLDGARICVSRKEWQAGLRGINNLWPVSRVASMAYKLARVACGLDDATFSLKRRKEWGICAGVALIEAAGGCATLLDGSEIRFNRPLPKQPSGIIAAGPKLHRALLAVFQLCGHTPETRSPAPVKPISKPHTYWYSRAAR
jgi:myo-inositol-1(or 4)-monophosphatase